MSITISNYRAKKTAAKKLQQNKKTGIDCYE